MKNWKCHISVLYLYYCIMSRCRDEAMQQSRCKPSRLGCLVKIYVQEHKRRNAAVIERRTERQKRNIKKKTRQELFDVLCQFFERVFKCKLLELIWCEISWKAGQYYRKNKKLNNKCVVYKQYNKHQKITIGKFVTNIQFFLLICRLPNINNKKTSPRLIHIGVVHYKGCQIAMTTNVIAGSLQTTGGGCTNTQCAMTAKLTINRSKYYIQILLL